MKRVAKNPLEWAVFAVSLVLVSATFGYLLSESIGADERPPDIVVALGQPAPGSGGFMVPVVATNRGGETAEDVRIAVTLERPGAAAEQSIMLLPYLPRESTRKGWVVFQSDPSAGSLRVSGVGFQGP
jgi:uncharacterized protein (TIGR02588 family)